jgi:hypothetical protein
MILRKSPRFAAFLLGVATAVTAVSIVVAIRNFPQDGRRDQRKRAEDRLRVLKPYLMENAVTAELGVLKGDFSRQIIQFLKPAVVAQAG